MVPANRTLMNVILFICSLVSSFILAEAGVRIIAPQNLSGSWRTNSSTGLFVNKSEGSAQHQLDDRVVYYRFYPPHLRDTELNNDEYTILALGDSFTFGWLLNKNGTFIDRLQTLTDIEFGDHTFNVVNAAAGGWGTADYVAYVEEFGEIVSPDVIIIFMNTDDIGRSLKSPLYSFKDRASLLLKRNRVEPGALKKLTEFLPFYEWSLENLHSLQLLRRAYLTLGSGHVPAR